MNESGHELGWSVNGGVPEEAGVGWRIATIKIHSKIIQLPSWDTALGDITAPIRAVTENAFFSTNTRCNNRQQLHV